MGVAGAGAGTIFGGRKAFPPNGAPSALIVTGITDTTQTFSFTIGSTNHDGHRLYMSTDGGVNYSLKASVLGATSTIQATGLTAGALYYFYVVAYKGTTESTATNIYDTYFKITVDTTKAGSANDTFILGTSNSGTFNYYIDWGDGGAEEHVVVNTAQTHVYSASGVYQLKIRGTFPWIYQDAGGDQLKVLSIDNWGNIKRGSTIRNGFRNCSNMVGTFIDVPNLSATTELNNFFLSCSKFNSPIINWSIPEALSMTSFLAACLEYDSPISFINATKLTDANSFLLSCAKFNKPVNFSFPALTICERFFQGCTKLNSSVAMTTGLVQNMKYMFAYCTDFQQLIDFNIESLTDATDMFLGDTLSLEIYEAMLIDWAAQDVNDSVHFGGGNSYLLYGSDGLTAKDHLVSTHSWVITDEGHTFDNGKIVFSFDDEYDSQYAAVPGVLASESVNGTFYIRTDHVGTAGYATWANLQTLNTAGFDIQCHTNSHTNFNGLTNQQILDELTAVEVAFAANSLPAPLHTAYPQGNCTPAQALVVATKRSSGRGIYEGLFTSGRSKMFLCSYQMDSKTVVAIKAIIDLAKAGSKAATFYAHEFNKAGSLSTAQLTEIVQYAKSVGVDILTITELYALMD